MTINFDKLLTSRNFQFLVGLNDQDRTPFTIHTTVVETLSGPLATLMNGSMCEALNGVATLEEVDEQTFVRFCEYAYRGDYTPAQQQIVLPSSKFDRGGLLLSVIMGKEPSWLRRSLRRKSAASSWKISMPV
ncbi:hypothetical protein BKA61DRAFT_166843 [Leptodontidium sp. MPI-SDFR-AT-0119]|nr:hypothetical protein BKA61DRAFT_166843 [Leptodontidium sp. MPI-SDFR-AT-0119]